MVARIHLGVERAFEPQSRLVQEDRTGFPCLPWDAREAVPRGSGQLAAQVAVVLPQQPFTALKVNDPALRAGLAPYNTAYDVDRLLDGISSFLR